MKRVTVYATRTCPFCSAAKQLLDSLGVEFDEVLLDDDPALRASLSAELGGWRTVPMVVAGGELLGGFHELMQLHARGELLARLGPAPDEGA